MQGVVDRVRAVYAGWDRTTTPERMRADWDRLFEGEPVQAAASPATLGGVPCRVFEPAVVEGGRTVLYCHGGGFAIGSTRSHAALMSAIAVAAAARVVGVDYRRAPEHRFPAPLDDARAVWHSLVAGTESAASGRRLALAGDSAGGQVALSLALEQAREPASRPAAVVLLSPWTDLSASGASYTTRAERDPINTRPMVAAMAKRFLGDVDARDPLASPRFASAAALAALPPTLVQVGDREVVLSDSTDFAERARAAGAEVELEVYDDMIHVFQQFSRELAAARRAVESIGRFLRAKVPA